MINLFFSYSHKDETIRDELDKHLSILKRQGIINAWHDRRISAGSEVDMEISNNLKSADIILLLVSSDFLASDYCYDKEMQFAMELHGTGKATVIPVILRPCDWHNAPFGKLLAAPTDGKPVIKFASYDEGFLEVTNAIKQVVQNRIPNETQSSKGSPIFQRIPSPIELRSSNLRIAKQFTDQEKDKFLDDAFEYIANYFEGSLNELKNRNSEVDYLFKRLDSQSFSAVVYIYQTTKAQCMIFYGGGNMLNRNGISYSNSVSNSRNTMNGNSLTMEEDENMLYLKPLMGGIGYRTEGKMTFEGAAEHFWSMFIEPLQRQF